MRVLPSRPIRLTNNANPVALLVTLTSPSDAFVTSLGGGLLTLTAGSGGGDLTLVAAANVATGGDSTFTGAVDITTSNFTNANVLTGGSINVHGQLTVDGGAGGTLTANAGSVTLQTAAGYFTLNGKMTFNGTTDLTGTVGNSIIVSTGANYDGFNQVTANTCSLILQGVLTGNPLVLNCPFGAGTIANSTGDVTLNGPLTFSGQSLAIPRLRQVPRPGTSTSINLTSGTANGGNLTMVAGFDFTPATAGQVGQTEPI